MYDIVRVIGFVQSLFGVLIFLTKRPKHLSFVFLTIWMGLIAVHMGAGLLPFQVVEFFRPGVFPIMFLTGPLFYLYISSLAIEDFKIKPIQLLHLIPFLLVVIHRSTIRGVPISGIPDLTENPDYIYNKIYYSFLMISVFAYWFFGLKLILKHRKNIPLYFSNYNSKNTLTWLIFVLSLFLVLFITSFFTFFMSKVLELEIARYSTLSFNLTIFTFIMVYFGINQNAIYEKPAMRFKKPKPEVQANNSAPKYIGSSLTSAQIESLSKSINNYLKEQKPYLNNQYNLQMMADDLDISKHNLSQVINSGQKKNFYKFINEFRVEEVKEKLMDPSYKHYSILGIALECGFNSKTTFNRIFKEETGYTPTEYLKNKLPQKGFK
ncbi:helix-turn-helix domain-containing protein [Flexithrix dorotheae]|uniref:helix-turn-helix domain-containing protein n=1 Tax=Flexithrix dorotheae TaxID=70993 RepID=UPI0005C6C4DC|nr:helix-turn-helix domain-containing protein [Flexithrix dorotheae]